MYRREFSQTVDQWSEEEMNHTLKREIQLARNIQMKLLNGEHPEVENGKVSGVSIPARLIGGDYYDFHILPNGKLRIVIGDVMGKGIPAAMLMILTRGAFRSAAESTKGPGETLAAMNKAMYQDLRTLGSFVTVFCADWDPENRQLTYANAGHNIPLVVRSKDEVAEIPKTKGVMIGGLPDQDYPENFIILDEENIVLFYTDGIVEAQDDEREMYRVERLHQVLLDNHHQDVHAIEESIVNSIHAFTQGVPQKDDITMVLLKVNQEKTDITSYNSPVIHP
ncbi:serine/threonine-protein phosphatase [Aquibacillus sp. 3ASR75-11]|uniref:Serine/threonine-protein phosphatase n=1 Tax=Terrihalobacillus insolitus TaxID=2950438 RepID=A0A9X3WXA6_9BACI|nr:PP2C family protein-serine/threonine phosphatase [Terrihalobacillus insolitus]MDC3414979.1 serine/threonine-protein phosphatase [Terrihalobacillus insolitus]MDC3425886.1 serine/threonine-protein phosphatase [Terrihalobacillus insolitus]